jgi:hypothetical protein
MGLCAETETEVLATMLKLVMSVQFDEGQFSLFMSEVGKWIMMAKADDEGWRPASGRGSEVGGGVPDLTRGNSGSRHSLKVRI